MKKIIFAMIALVIIPTVFNLSPAYGQAKGKSGWAGVWSLPDRFSPGTLTIKTISATKFSFELDASNGANQGGVSGTAKITGMKAVFNDRLATGKDAEKYGCVLTFTHKGSSIGVDQTQECSNYAGNAVYFAGDYRKGKGPALKDTLVTRAVLPNAKIDGKFKTLVGAKEYENFLNDFHLIYEDEDLDGLSAKVFSACVRGICPYNAGIIMYDGSDHLWAAIMNIEEDNHPKVYYYTNVPEWTQKMPKTIEAWTKEKGETNENLTVVYKSK